jgi:carboxylesterase type B
MQFPVSMGRQLLAAYGSQEQYDTNIASDMLFTEPAHFMARTHSQVAPGAGTGDPNSDSRARWPRYNATEDNLINFTNSGAVQAKVPRAAALDVIASSYMP